jgi:hypothetical protein
VHPVILPIHVEYIVAHFADGHDLLPGGNPINYMFGVPQAVKDQIKALYERHAKIFNDE